MEGLPGAELLPRRAPAAADAAEIRQGRGPVRRVGRQDGGVRGGAGWESAGGSRGHVPQRERHGGERGACGVHHGGARPGADLRGARDHGGGGRVVDEGHALRCHRGHPVRGRAGAHRRPEPAAGPDPRGLRHRRAPRHRRALRAERARGRQGEDAKEDGREEGGRRARLPHLQPAEPERAAGAGPHAAATGPHHRHDAGPLRAAGHRPLRAAGYEVGAAEEARVSFPSLVCLRCI
mmetsp:Transcript_27701/g.87877  ORF Transcript_27701/g.87877 Transcript_27701/m.87877 type:complete len:236 (-) Transcript_27701:1734-2441(-)